jgi:r-opsin
LTSEYYFTVHYSHPKYRAVLTKKFPSLTCANAEDDSASVASGTTTVSEEKTSAA